MKEGQKISVSEFNFTNLSGGTGDSKPFSHNSRFQKEYFEEDVDIIITKVWNDYETGRRGWAIPDTGNKELMDFLKRNCKQGHNRIFDTGLGYADSEWVDQKGEFILYWSEFDIV